MQAVRQIIARIKIASVQIPEEFGEQVEVIIFPVAVTPAVPTQSMVLPVIQEQSGFAVQVLAATQEDVWNDI